jgi:hypothetical protein
MQCSQPSCSLASTAIRCDAFSTQGGPMQGSKKTVVQLDHPRATCIKHFLLWEFMPDSIPSSLSSFFPIQQKPVNMFSATVAARSLALRSRPLRVSLSLQHSQPQSTSTSSGTDNYWQQIKPWKDVSAEEFMSYRWQVGSRSPQCPVSPLTIPASKHRTRYKKATFFSLRSIITNFGQIQQPTVAKNKDKRAIHRRRCSSSQIGPYGYPPDSAHSIMY